MTEKEYWDIIHSEMVDLAKIVMKYSREQLANMLFGVDIDSLHEDMVKHGATRDDFLTVSECIHDISTAYKDDESNEN